ncbi:hypothetical protein V1227_31645 [Lentzea sp. DG1S-22]|uniref:hypothetical protein n=1 Tax=Lentzea sp. DG1S-22 TaxID=3108822 RepID=UPI002E7AA6E1|nr:hypothetical protein [Lentzea sp. DG1S-22]WVH79550.1 hypothetical protein V1227_31645 [Lentzea sp. DG1S-22]
MTVRLAWTSGLSCAYSPAAPAGRERRPRLAVHDEVILRASAPAATAGSASHLVSALTARTWQAPEVLCNTGFVRVTFFEFFYGIRTPAPVVV